MAAIITKGQALRAATAHREASCQAADYGLAELASRESLMSRRAYALSLSLAARLYALLGTGATRDLALTALVLATALTVVYAADVIAHLL